MVCSPAKTMSTGAPPLAKAEHLKVVADQQAAPSASDLEKVRRLDWRFLLSEPRLGCVLYYGPAGSDLLDALETFAQQVVIYLPESPAVMNSQFDVAVAHAPSYEVLRHMAGMLAPGGTFYIEGNRTWSTGARRSGGAGSPLRSAEAVLKACQSLGLTDANGHWHWPNLEGCLEMIPLGSSTAMACALARRSSDWRVRLRSRLVSWLSRRRWWSRMAPSFSVVARRKSMARGVSV